jgi:hypothetical protein
MRSIMKSFTTAIRDAFGVTALSSLLHRIEGEASATKQMLSEQHLREAGWLAAIANRQLKTEQSVRDIEIALSRIAKQVDMLVLDNERRLLGASAQPQGSSHKLEQTQDSDHEQI